MRSSSCVTWKNAPKIDYRGERDGVSSEPPGAWTTCISSPDVESSTASPTVTFNVGGRIFQLAKSTIDKYPSTVLAVTVSDRWTNGDITTPIFLDRNPEAFAFVLDWYRNGRIVLPTPHISA
mmetsp:Transcript_4521/g.4401  ORF Transcript_4521/g.4401 Transcript_4521/m.4401 type:complete len:122 (+) Transcript_4521:105-470(+)